MREEVNAQRIELFMKKLVVRQGNLLESILLVAQLRIAWLARVHY